MANKRNLVQFSGRSREEVEEINRKGGKASGKARRKKADFRKTLNALLTAEIDSPEWSPILGTLGLESTLEAAVNAALIREALNGNVKAYEAIAKYSGQSDKTDTDQEEQSLRMAAAKSKMGVDDKEEAEDDGFLDALKGTVEKDWKGWEEHEQEDKETDI